MKISRIATAAVGALAIVAVISGGAHAATSKCSSGKIKSSGKKAQAKLGCLSKALGKGLTSVDSTCLAKADVKFSSAFAKAELKGRIA